MSSGDNTTPGAGTSSSSSTGAGAGAGAPPGAFAYQQRLLDRTSSLSRSGSLSGRGLFPQPAQTNSATPVGTRRWTPSHRVANSMDTVRARWEDKSRGDAQDAFLPSSSSTSSSSSQTLPTSSSGESVRHSVATNDTGLSSSSSSSSTSTPTGAPVRQRYSLYATQLQPQPATTSEPESAATSARNRRSTIDFSVTSLESLSRQSAAPVSAPAPVTPPSPATASPSSTDTVIHPFGTLRKTSSIGRSPVPTSPSPAAFVTLRKTSGADNSSTSPTSSNFATTRRSPLAQAIYEPSSPSPLGLRRNSSTEARPNPRTFSTESTREPLDRPTILTNSFEPVASSSSPLTDLRRNSSTEARPAPDSLRRAPPAESTRESPLRPAIQTDSSEPVASTSASTSSEATSVMTPAPYRSSYMAKKKAGLYGMGSGAIGKKLGSHLPRIASGDGNEAWPIDKDAPNEDDDDDPPPVPRRSRFRLAASSEPPTETDVEREAAEKEREKAQKEREERERAAALQETKRNREARRGHWVRDEKPLPSEPMSPSPSMRSPTTTTTKRQSAVFEFPPPLPSPPVLSPSSPNGKNGIVLPEMPGDDVQGMRGRLRLSKTPGHVPKTSLSAGGTAVPSTRFGLWADVQRHLLQAYEYLCHVGEAQQWIEGCLGEELGFGVVEMDNGLQNGVVLAKLARVFGADVKKIREERGHSWYHMENITAFLKFVRDLGLPECFIFEPTDLYDKKNIPKVIFCIHALSHFLARRGMAQRMGNLLGRLQFSDDQLRQTQKGLKDAGVPMPNFSSVGRELAREINEEPEETEEDRRDRMLLEVEDSIVAVQTLARRFLARKAHAARLLRLRIAERSIAGLQARSRGVLARQSIIQQRKTTADLAPWARALQAMARGVLARRRWRERLRRVRAATRTVVKIQAQARGVLQRRRFARLRAALRTSKASFIKLQALARAKVVRTSHVQLSKTFAQPHLATSVVGIQSAARGLLRRQQAKKQLAVLTGFVAPRMVGLQAHVRGVLVRRHVRAQLAKLDDVTEIVVRIQAAAGAFLARRRLLMLIRGLRSVVPVVTGLQARARAKLLRQKQQNVVKKLEDVQVVKSVGGFQALARAAIARNRGREQLKKLEFVEPDVRGFQAVCRGALVRDEFWAWRRYLHESQEEATYLQKLLRGLTVRKEFHAKLAYYRANLDKVVKIQALFRAKETREQYRQLAVGKNVTVGTIKNFVHLLDDSEKDFEDEIELERRRKKIVELVREVQNLENEVADLDVKIALVVNNVKSFETTRKTTHASRPSLAAHGDPFAGPSSLDASTRRKLELYQQLFYLLQTHGDYFARLFYVLSRAELPDKTKRLAERVILTLYGFGQDRREEYLLLKMLQAAAIEEIRTAPSVRDLLAGNPMYINVAVQYIRPKQVSFVKEALQHMVRLVVDETELDLETDPVAIYLARINIEEMQSGVVSKKSKNVGFHQAVDDPETRQEFIHHLQKLHALTKDFVHVITQSTRKMPYGMRCLARESLQTLKHYFPNETDDTYAAFIGRLIYYRYLHPAILAPETFDLVPNTIGSVARKNLSEISKMLMQICSGAIFGQENPCLMPLNSYVEEAIVQMNGWFFEVADVPEPEAFFHAHEFLDVTVQPRPIYISPNEVYSMHTLLIQNLDRLTQSKEDPLRIIITELDGVPHLASDELRDARDRAVTLELTNRFANVEDPHAEEKALWVQAKRGVLAILRVQPSNDLYDSLLQDVTEEHEGVWADIVDQQVAANKLVAERVHPRNRREPSTMANEGGTYRLEDIQSLSFHEVKIRAISYLLELEKLGKVTRNDSYQAILNAIASDVRSKHRKRIQRDMEIEGLGESRKYLEERKKQFQEQIKSYNSYVNNTMSTMHGGKGKKRFVMPFSKQFFHQRDAQRSGRSAQFGTFKYSAQDLYDKGILLSMDQFSPRQFDRIDIVLSSNKMHVFTFEIYNNGMSSSILVGETELRMEDLLQAQFENRISLALFDGMVKVHVNLLLFQINKKFYV